ncbi:MAG: radical SAM protein [Promethearchaeota archaeon]
MRQYTYGPYPSRRLGLSLGIDILPREKTCTFNCVYCEIGRTKNLVPPTFRMKLPPKANFRDELIDILKYFPHLNSMTFGYNGEPTLNDNILEYLEIARDVRDSLNWKEKKPKLTLFTNSSTLIDEEVIEKIKNFDFILAKLDVATPDDFKRTNRPHPECPRITKIIESLCKLRKKIGKGKKLGIQCLIFDSYRKDFMPNNNERNIIAIAKAINEIKPDEVQLYSIARIPAEYYVYSIDQCRKKEIVETFRKMVNSNKIEINYY